MEPNLTIYTDGSTSGEQENGNTKHGQTKKGDKGKHHKGEKKKGTGHLCFRKRMTENVKCLDGW